jgi:hypothetical protein
MSTILCSSMLLCSAGTSSSPEDYPEPAPSASSSGITSSSAFPCTATCRITAVTLSSLPSKCPSTLSISLIVSQPSWMSFSGPGCPPRVFALTLPAAASSGLRSARPPLRYSLFLGNFQFILYSSLFDHVGLPSAWLPSFPPSWPSWVLLCRSSERSP